MAYKAPEVDRAFEQLNAAFRGVLDRLGDEWTNIALERDRAVKERDQLLQELLQDREALAKERSRFEQLHKRMEASVVPDPTCRVRLNVGGQLFETTLDTLCVEPDSMLSAMFSGRYSLDQAPDGSCFLDRDPNLFREVLSYLRSAREQKLLISDAPIPDRADEIVSTPEPYHRHFEQFSEQEKDLLVREAQFYAIDPLVRLLTQHHLEVSQDLKARYRRISDALIDAKDGDAIVVKPGTYVDTFVMERSVEIVGDGPKGSVIIRSTSGTIVECRSAGGLLRNLVLEGGGYGAPAPDYYCVLITEGGVTIENCEIRNAGLSCVKVMGDKENACPTLRGNLIHHACQCGILVTNKAGGVIEQNEIFENKFSGIEIRGTSAPVVKANNIHDNKQNGVYVHSSGSGVLDSNTIVNNNFNGINVEGKVVVRANSVSNNFKRGIYHTADTILEGNDVQRNILSDVALKR